MSSSFSAACEEGNLDEIRAILQADPISGNKLLSEKGADGWWHWMREIFASNNIDAKTNNGKTAFHLALDPQNVNLVYLV